MDLKCLKRSEWEVPPNQWWICHFHLQCLPDWMQHSSVAWNPAGYWGSEKAPEALFLAEEWKKELILKIQSIEISPFFPPSSLKPQLSSNPTHSDIRSPNKKGTKTFRKETFLSDTKRVSVPSLHSLSSYCLALDASILQNRITDTWTF